MLHATDTMGSVGALRAESGKKDTSGSAKGSGLGTRAGFVPAFTGGRERNAVGSREERCRGAPHERGLVTSRPWPWIFSRRASSKKCRSRPVAVDVEGDVGISQGARQRGGGAFRTSHSSSIVEQGEKYVFNCSYGQVEGGTMVVVVAVEAGLAADGTAQRKPAEEMRVAIISDKTTRLSEPIS
jgi:hypothetical protein